MNHPFRHFLAAALLSAALPAAAQYNPYSSKYASTQPASYGTFYAEYNPTVWHYSHSGLSDDTHYHGVSVGFSYYVPLAGVVGIDAGFKGQYFFRNKNVEPSIKDKSNMFSATVPVDLVFSLPVTNGFSVAPFAGVYGRYNFSAKRVTEINGQRQSVNLFNDAQVTLASETKLNRFQAGCQAGVNFRFSEAFTVGAAYWMDLSEVKDHTRLHGFNITLGANF